MYIWRAIYYLQVHLYFVGAHCCYAYGAKPLLFICEFPYNCCCRKYSYTLSEGVNKIWPVFTTFLARISIYVQYCPIIMSLKVCHPCFVCITRNKKDSIRHYETLYYSKSKIVTYFGHHQALCFENVKFYFVFLKQLHVSAATAQTCSYFRFATRELCIDWLYPYCCELWVSLKSVQWKLYFT